MQSLAYAVDLLLYALVAGTLALVTYKVLHLFKPQWVGMRSLAEQLGVRDRKGLDEVVEGLESGMTLLAVIAAAAPFVGLAGTVMHIIEALKAMSGAGVDLAVISGPIVTALNSTLVGLASAVPAVVAYNLLQRRLQVLENRAARSLA